MAERYDQNGMYKDSMTSALKSLNEQDYINKLYGENSEAEKKLIQENYTDNAGILNTEQDRVEQQAQDHVNRTQVEANSTAQNVYNGPKLSYGAGAQASLAQENALRGNANALNQGLDVVRQEYERQRQLLASQYETAIKQAQADNDMQKAQALYEAAKREEQQLLDAYQKEAEMLASFGEEEEADAIMEKLLFGGALNANFSGNTSKDVLKYEDEIRKMYDSKYESESLGLRSQLAEALSDIQARQETQQRQTDEKLTETYVQALQKAKNYAEVQNAYGMGSGSFGQAQLAQDTELQKALTDLRLLQLDTDAKTGVQRLDAYRDFSKNLQQRQAAINLERAKEMLAAAESQEEQKLAMEELMLQYYLLNPPKSNDDSGGGGGGGYSGGGGGGSSSGGGSTIMEQANQLYHAGASSKELTSFLEDKAAGGTLAGGNLNDYLAIYT